VHTTFRGHLTDLVRDGGRLTIRLTPEGREVLDQEHDLPDDVVVWRLLEEHRESWGWERVWPDEIGALTSDSSLILSDSVERDDRGRIIEVGTVFHYPRYALDLYTEVLLERGEVVFEAA
jgi:hypothetical protein